MLISEILSADCTKSAVPCSSKKRVLEIISELAAPDWDLMNKRYLTVCRPGKKMGTTGIGSAIAIPHGRIPDGYPVTGILLTLEQPIPFDAIDNQPVDLLFAMLVPESECKTHLKTLALVAEKFNDKNFCRQLRLAESDEALYQQMING